MTRPSIPSLIADGRLEDVFEALRRSSLEQRTEREIVDLWRHLGRLQARLTARELDGASYNAERRAIGVALATLLGVDVGPPAPTSSASCGSPGGPPGDDPRPLAPAMRQLYALLCALYGPDIASLDRNLAHHMPDDYRVGIAWNTAPAAIFHDLIELVRKRGEFPELFGMLVLEFAKRRAELGELAALFGPSID